MIPLPSAETSTQAAISTPTSSGKSIVSGAASSAKRSESGSTIVAFAVKSSSAATIPTG